MDNEIVMKAIELAKKMSKDDIEKLEKLKCQPFFHLWDCGGQPVFLEVLPIFLTSRTMFLLFFNAAIDLNSPWESVYYKDGKKHVEGEVNITTQQMMERWIASIYSLVFDEANDPGYPRVIPIGTRADELKRCGINPAVIKKKIEDSIMSKSALCHVMKDPIVIDNTTSGKGDNEDPGYKYVRNEVINTTMSKLKKKTPLAWILYRKLLQLFVNEFNNNIVSLQDAYVIGGIAKIQQSDVESVLKFYHELGVLLWYPNIKALHDKVILNPKWFVDCIGKVLTLPGTGEEQFEDKGEWELLRSKGILVQRLYTKVWSDCEGIEAEDIIDLLIHFQLLCQVQTDIHLYKDAKQYFVPAILPYTTIPKVGSSIH